MGTSRRVRRSFSIALVSMVALSGAAAAAGLTLVERSVTIKGRPPLSTSPLPAKSVTAPCPAGKHLALGGYAADLGLDPTDAQIAPLAFARSHDGWRVRGVNGGQQAGTLTSLAWCGHRSPIDAQETKAARVGPGESDSVTARCPSGERVVLGGASGELLDDGAVLITAMRRTTKRSWQVRGANLQGSSSGRLTAIAYCGRSATKEVVAEATVAPGTKAGVTARCPRGSRVRFGGFSAPFDASDGKPGSVIGKLARGLAREWNLRAIANPSNPNAVTIRAFAYCR